MDPLSSSLPSTALTSSSSTLNQPIIQEGSGMRVSLGERLSSFPGLGSKKTKRNLSMSSKELVIDQEENLDSSGPIERFEKCNGAEGLVMGDIALLVKDYQRLAKIGRKHGIWK
ncbi:uncharacterized protein MELLADRAFT_71965 [Melampsora larici-populina 98AG31]|uniref:Uncharacterized protein n=1 Tax=Melampsora larici-populina (strain 98AG31 / pathotype 3-4-7) TaxID=747676 RepID=F4RN05_MELLP|nr:uncharacterized protein MELLADRAFT_71965 [Melampsora larici-populina 98AG31]EGG06215.1 hypothetical protein MELLADRAFT_71965 [Melampsora larici-populina 98AG31]